MNEVTCVNRVVKWVVRCSLLILTCTLCGAVDTPNALAGTEQIQMASKSPLARAKIFLQAGDYRRAVEAWQRNIDDHPSVEA